MAPPAHSADRIRALNDGMRKNGPCTTVSYRWMMTDGTLDLGADAVRVAVSKVQSFTDFTDDNDPHGEHDFGAFDVLGHQLFWKIDYYDPALTSGSADPADDTQTCRVLTIMLASEY